MARIGILDWLIIVGYFIGVASIGPIFARRNKSTESFFLGNRAFPSWLLGLAMFATSISSITVVAFPADAFKTAYLRLLPAFMLPVGIFIASKVFLPYFRRSRCTSAFEYLEGRFGPGVRMYAACAFLFGQIMRISTILYLVSLVFQQMTGATPYVCIVAGGLVIAIYTVAGGIQAIVWAQFIQAFVLWFGSGLCFYTVVRGIDGGIATIISTALADGKFIPGDPNPVTGQIEMAPWFSLQEKAIVMVMLMGLTNWLMEYSSNQNVIQKYVAAKNPKEATRSIWICCFCSVPTWTFFMFLGTSLYVYFKLNPDPQAQAIMTGAGGREGGIDPAVLLRARDSARARGAGYRGRAVRCDVRLVVEHQRNIRGGCYGHLPAAHGQAPRRAPLRIRGAAHLGDQLRAHDGGRDALP